MEKLLLKVLSFDLCAPSSLSFISIFSNAMGAPDNVKFMAQVSSGGRNRVFDRNQSLFQYFCELSLMKGLPFLNFVPSQVSAAAMALAHYHNESPIWNKKMQDTFGYDSEELKDIIFHLSELHNEAETLQQQAIQEKYKSSKYLSVANIPPKTFSMDELNELIKLGESEDLCSNLLENSLCVRTAEGMLFN